MKLGRLTLRHTIAGLLWSLSVRRAADLQQLFVPHAAHPQSINGNYKSLLLVGMVYLKPIGCSSETKQLHVGMPISQVCFMQCIEPKHFQALSPLIYASTSTSIILSAARQLSHWLLGHHSHVEHALCTASMQQAGMAMAKQTLLAN